MRPPSPVCVDDDLATREPGVAVGTANHETARGVKVIDRVVVEVLGRHHVFDHELQKVCADLFVGNVIVVLSGYHDRVYPQWYHAPILFLVSHCHLYGYAHESIGENSSEYPVYTALTVRQYLTMCAFIDKRGLIDFRHMSLELVTLCVIRLHRERR